jgi:hypothetical protein
MALREYPTNRPSSAPATGRYFYEYLMRNIRIPASANHKIWYAGEEAKLKALDKYSFRGDIPIGRSLELKTLEGMPIKGFVDNSSVDWTFNGKENYVLVSDLTEKSRQELQIPPGAKDKDKVFNSNFKPYEMLGDYTKFSNELAALSIPKSISSYLSGIKMKVNYSEKDVLQFLTSSLDDLSGPEMTYLMHGNHLAWIALNYIRENGNVKGDLLLEFYGQNPVDFYSKDLGTILPGIFYAAANLGKDPLEMYKKLDIEVWGAKETAEYIRQFMNLL